ncbi:MAG: serine/threonine protein kinase [Spirochaetales bacterium]|nr:serine/threonine protein kinase [Spirochaetales bacterium]
MAARRTTKKSGRKRKDTLERFLFPPKKTSKKSSSRSKASPKSKPKAKAKKSAARSKSTPKKAAGKKSAARSKSAPKKAAPKAKSKAKTKKTPARSARTPKKKTSRAKPAAKRASLKSKPKSKAKAKSAPKAKAKKAPVRSARGKPKKAAKKKVAARSARAPKKAVAKKTPVRSARKIKKAASRAKPAVKKIVRAKPAVKKIARAKPAAKKAAAGAKPAAKKNTLDNYKIVSMIGEGGMGKVYKVLDKRKKKIIIMKQLILTQREILVKRFKREADLMLSLNHKNIVTVYDYLKKGSSYFIIMEFVDGIPLEDLIWKKGRLEPVRALLIFNELCKGLKYAHDRQIIHRDIKPNNVLISKTGVVKLLDFGIAKSLREEDEALTRTGVVMGTPAYMSPEQLIDTKYVDILTDIYSMGVMFYQMITGEKPYPGEFTAENIRKITLGDYTNPKQLNPDLPGHCLQIVKMAMHHKKEKRVKDLQELIDYMSRHLSQFKTQKQINNEIKKALADL